MTKKITKEFGNVRMFELKKGLFIHEGNYEDFLKMYNLAIQRNKDDFPFRNDSGELYKVETAFVSFVLKTFQEHDHNILVGEANKYKSNEEKLTGEELEKAQKELTEEYDKRQGLLDEKGKLYDTDGQVINKVDPAKEYRRNLLKKEIKKRQKPKNK
tara:strand:- start:29 stop:499 length:471 start_codon:yes stop_codon:yes gene_type:complete